MDPNERLWSLVNDGKSGPLRKFLAENIDKSTLDFKHVRDDLSGDGENVVIQCVKKLGGSKPSGFGHDHVACIRCLEEHGVDLGYRDRAGRTALHWAVSNKNVLLVKGLLQLKVDKTIFDDDGLTPFHIAVQVGSKECVDILAEHDDKILDSQDAWGYTPLISAILQGNLEMCQHLVDKGADVDQSERRKKRTPLHLAVYKRRIDIFELLLKANAKLNVVDHKRTTVLHRCCGLDDPTFLKKLIAIHKNLPKNIMELESEGGATALLVACQNGNSQQLKELLDQGASVDVWDNSGRTPLHHCSENLETQCAEMILKVEGADKLIDRKEEHGLTTMQMAVIAGNAPLLRLILAKGGDVTCVDNEDHTVAHWATVCGHLEVFQVLLEKGAELSQSDSHQAYPLHYAAQAGSLRNGDKILKMMLDNKVRVDVVDADGRQPLLWAASSGHAETCRTLVKAGADINSTDNDGLTALHCAASRGHDACIEVLKKLGADCNKPDKNHCTPLYYAITLGNKNCTRLLLKSGSDPNHMDSKARTPTHCAAIKGCIETIQMLEKHKAEMWIPSIRGDLPLHEAAQGGHCDVVKHLLKQKNTVDAVNSKNNAGRTCLHIAAIINNLQLCKLLMDNGADKNTTMTHKGKLFTPYDVALLKEHHDTAEYLKSKGGRTAGDLANIEPKASDEANRPKSSKSGKSLTLDKTIEEEEKSESHKKEDDKIDENEKSVSEETPEVPAAEVPDPSESSEAAVEDKPVPVAQSPKKKIPKSPKKGDKSPKKEPVTKSPQKVKGTPAGSPKKTEKSPKKESKVPDSPSKSPPIRKESAEKLQKSASVDKESVTEVEPSEDGTIKVEDSETGHIEVVAAVNTPTVKEIPTKAVKHKMAQPVVSEQKPKAQKNKIPVEKKRRQMMTAPVKSENDKKFRTKPEQVVDFVRYKKNGENDLADVGHNKSSKYSLRHAPRSKVAEDIQRSFKTKPSEMGGSPAKMAEVEETEKSTKEAPAKKKPEKNTKKKPKGKTKPLQINGDISPEHTEHPTEELDSNEQITESPRSSKGSVKKVDMYKLSLREREEELRRRLMRAYHPMRPPSLFSSHNGKGSQQTYSAAPRSWHYSGASSYSEFGSLSSFYRSSASRPKTRQSTAVQMTPYGLRKVPLDCNSNGFLKGGAPKAGMGLRTRTALVFVEPDIYEDVLKEEKEIKKQRRKTGHSEDSGDHSFDSH
ncbi:hypothetical protein ScPMuIL_014874 [Solemya velum]